MPTSFISATIIGLSILLDIARQTPKARLVARGEEDKLGSGCSRARFRR
jgi:hypothetical protein